MTIYLAPWYFLTEKDETGSLFGYFCENGNQASQAIYSKELAYKILEKIIQDWELLPEEIKAIEIGIENSELELETTPEEIRQLRLSQIEINIDILFQTVEKMIKSDQFDSEIEINYKGREREKNTPPN